MKYYLFSELLTLPSRFLSLSYWLCCNVDAARAHSLKLMIQNLICSVEKEVFVNKSFTVTHLCFELQPLWDWLFFWQKVPNQILLEPQRFRLVNPHVIREAALDLLKYAPPRSRLWGWDQVIDTFKTSPFQYKYFTKWLYVQLWPKSWWTFHVHMKATLTSDTARKIIIIKYKVLPYAVYHQLWS